MDTEIHFFWPVYCMMWGMRHLWAVNDETVAKPLQPNEQGRKKFYYLFYRRQNDSEEIDKAELCRRLAGQFAKPGTKKRVRKSSIGSTI